MEAGHNALVHATVWDFFRGALVFAGMTFKIPVGRGREGLWFLRPRAVHRAVYSTLQ